MSFHNIEEKVIFDKLSRMRASGGVLSDDFAQSDALPEIYYPSFLPADQARGLLSQGNEGRIAMRRLQYNAADRPNRSSRSGMTGKMMNLIHRAARKLFLRWYVLPIAEQQTQFNMASVRSTDALASLQTQLIPGISEMEARQKEHAQQIGDLYQKLSQYQEALLQLAQRFPEESMAIRAILEETGLKSEEMKARK